MPVAVFQPAAERAAVDLLRQLVVALLLGLCHSQTAVGLDGVHRIAGIRGTGDRDIHFLGFVSRRGLLQFQQQLVHGELVART